MYKRDCPQASISCCIFLSISKIIYLSDFKPDTDIATVVTVSSSGPVAEMYPESLGQYNIIRDVFRNDHPVYKHVDRDDRFIVYYGNI